MINLDYPTSEPPSREHHFAWGMVDVGLCAKCTRPRTLFSHSAIAEPGDCDPLCWSCTQSVLSDRIRTFTYNADDAEMAGDTAKQDENNFLATLYRDLYHEWNDANEHQHTREQVLAHEKGCVACARFWDWNDPRRSNQPVQADDTNGNMVYVHDSCSFVCFECDTRFIAADLRNSVSVTIQTYVNGSGHACPSCTDNLLDSDYFRCSCGAVTHCDDSTYAWDTWYCSGCGENIHTCDYCDEEYWDDDGHDCERREADKVVHSFDFRPRGGFTYHGSDPNGLYLGFELEVECPEERGNYESMSEYAKDILEDRTNRGYLKQDGSLNYGFEIVSQPHTLDELHNSFPWDVVLELQRAGFRSWDTDTCGFHVHVSKRAFGWDVNKREQEGRVEAHAVRFIKLIYDNERYIQRLAGRSSDRWASFCDGKRIIPKVKHGYQGNDRYSAVNVSNQHTFEVRVFKGSMRVERIKANLEFVHAAVEYTRNLSVSPNNNTLQWGYFRKWLVGKPQYSNLTNLLDNLPRSRSAESEMN